MKTCYGVWLYINELYTMSLLRIKKHLDRDIGRNYLLEIRGYVLCVLTFHAYHGMLNTYLTQVALKKHMYIRFLFIRRTKMIACKEESCKRSLLQKSEVTFRKSQITIAIQRQ
ncbi:hypothetical protein BDC45DRAFT_533466 [Circinella umbellata]|nr:hypothetical protein BDC45DRAFT_533466 [Circinella umbellata]